MVYWNTGLHARKAARTSSSSNPSSPTIGRECRRSPRRALSCCRGSLTCGDAIERWSSNRLAPARCFGYAIRTSRPLWPFFRRRIKSRSCVDKMFFPKLSSSPCSLTAKLFSRSRPVAMAASAGSRVTMSSCFGIFTIFCSIRAAAKGGTPIRSGGVSPYAGTISPLPAIRPRWPGKKIALRSFSAAQSESASRTATLLRQRHSSRIFDDLHPSPLPSSHVFSKTRRPSCPEARLSAELAGR